MCKRQLFGYWNVTLNRGSPVCVTFPTDSKENLSTVRRTHITWPQNGTENGQQFWFDLSVFPVDAIFSWFRINERHPANEIDR